MLHDASATRKFLAVTPDELREVLSVRLATIDAACELHPGGVFLSPGTRSGLKAFLRVLDRDRDGSLRASVTVTAPWLRKPYVRRVRLVRTHSRASERTAHLRLA